MKIFVFYNYIGYKYVIFIIKIFTPFLYFPAPDFQIMQNKTNELISSPSVKFVCLKSKKNYLIVKAPEDDKFRLIKFDPYNGTPCYLGIFGKDIFNTEDDAMEYITKGEQVEQTVQGHVVIGLFSLEKFGLLIIVKSADPVYQYLQKHTFYKIKEVEIVGFSLLCGETNPDNNYEKVKSYPFTYNHYYCPTFDISKPFSGLSDFSAAMNSNISIAFDNLNIPNLCPKVIHGKMIIDHVEEFGADMLLIARKFASNRKKDRGLDNSGNPCLDYLLEFAFVQPRENGYITKSEIMCIGDIPLGPDGKTDEFQDKDIAKAYFEKLAKITGLNNFVNVVLFNEAKNATLAKVMNRLQAAVNSSEEDKLKFTLIKSKFQLSMERLDAVPAIIDLFYSVTDSKYESFRYSKVFENKCSRVVEAQQYGTFRIGFLDSLEEELFAIFSLLLKLPKMIHVSNTQIQHFADANKLPPKYLVGIAKFVIELGLSMRAFGNISVGPIKKLIAQFANYNEKPPRSPAFENIIDSFLILTTTPPLNYECVTLQSNAAVVEPQNVGNSLLRQSFKPITVPIDIPLIVMLSKPIYLTQIVLYFTDQPNLATPPSMAHVKAGLYINRLIDITENIAIPVAHEKGYIITIDLRPSKSYDPFYRVHDVEAVRFVAIDFMSPVSHATISGVGIFGTSKPPIPYPFENAHPRTTEDRRRVVLLDVKKATRAEDIIPFAIQYEITRVTGMHTVGEAITKLVTLDIHPDVYDMAKLSILKPPSGSAQKKKNCKTCNNERICYLCWFCGEYFCADHSTIYKDARLCRVCQSQIKQLDQSAEILTGQKIQSYLDNNPYIKSHKKKLDYLSHFKRSNIKSIGIYPFCTVMNEQPKGEHKIPFDAVFCDSDVLYKPNLNMMHVQLALESFCNITGIEVVCDEPLSITINNTDTLLHFAPPSSFQKCAVNARFLELVIMSESIAIRRIRIIGEPIKNTVEVRNPVANLPKPFVISNCSVDLVEKNLIHVINFEKPTTVSGFRFFKTWKNLKAVVFEIRIPNKPPRYIQRFCCSGNLKEADLIFNSRAKATQIKIYYVSLSDKDVQAVVENLPPIPIDFKSGK